MRRGACAAWLATALLLAACGGAPFPGEPAAPRDGRAGLRLAGTVGGRQVVVNDGTPELVVGDCDPGDGRDQDVCFIANDLDGQLFVLVLENPDVATPDVSLSIASPRCGAPEACDDVTDVAVVDVQFGTDDRIRATGGTLRLDVVEPFLRYAGELRLEFAQGRLSGEFDVVS